jgi:hypothetical protein
MLERQRKWEYEDDESIEEIFGQLCAIPKPGKVRVPPSQGHGRGMLAWIHKDLVEQWRIQSDDCFSVSKSQRIGSAPIRLSFAKDIWGGGDRATYAEILKRIPMVEGGCWVWQADKPERGRGRSQQSRGRGEGFRQARPCPPLQPPQRQPQNQERGGPPHRQPQIQAHKAPPQDQADQQHQPVKVEVNSPGRRAVIDPRYRALTCYNYEEPDHFVGICDKPKVCFICAVPGHYMNACHYGKRNNQ